MEIQTVDFNVWPKGKFNADYAQFFTGNSYLATLEGGLLNVTFEPGPSSAENFTQARAYSAVIFP